MSPARFVERVKQPIVIFAEKESIAGVGNQEADPPAGVHEWRQHAQHGEGHAVQTVSGMCEIKFLIRYIKAQ